MDHFGPIFVLENTYASLGIVLKLSGILNEGNYYVHFILFFYN